MAALVLAGSLAGTGALHRVTESRAVVGGCGATTLHRGPAPSWAAHSNPPPGFVPHATTQRRAAAAYIFAYPALRAGHPRKTSNKILWLTRSPGSGLAIRATPLHKNAPVITVKLTDSAGPEIYPSYVNVPHIGCWHLTLRWARHRDFIDLYYRG